MNTFNINFTFGNSTSLNFDKVKPEDISEIIKLIIMYSDVSSITINKNY